MEGGVRSVDRTAMEVTDAELDTKLSSDQAESQISRLALDIGGDFSTEFSFDFVHFVFG